MWEKTTGARHRQGRISLAPVEHEGRWTCLTIFLVTDKSGACHRQETNPTSIKQRNREKEIKPVTPHTKEAKLL
jgi:hypothetical protein